MGHPAPLPARPPVELGGSDIYLGHACLHSPLTGPRPTTRGQSASPSHNDAVSVHMNRPAGPSSIETFKEQPGAHSTGCFCSNMGCPALREDSLWLVDFIGCISSVIRPPFRRPVLAHHTKVPPQT